MVQPLRILPALCWILFCLPTFLLSWGPKRTRHFQYNFKNAEPTRGTRAWVAPWLIFLYATSHDRLSTQFLVHITHFHKPTTTTYMLLPVSDAGLVCQLWEAPAHHDPSEQQICPPIYQLLPPTFPFSHRWTHQGLICHTHIIKLKSRIQSVFP